MKHVKPYLLVSCIGISAVIMTLVGFFYENTVYSNRSFDPFREPPVSAGMLAIKEDCLLTPFFPESKAASVHMDCFAKPVLSASSLFQIAEWEAKTAEKHFTKVDESYFQDALFIGDSRTAGIELYAGFQNATFYAATSMNVFDFDTRKINVDGTKMTVKDALTLHQFQKIYIMLGINDVGVNTIDTFFHSYSDMVKEIMRLQPDAIIFLQGNLHVTEKKSAADSIINNENIEARNQRIASLADNKRIFYIDVNESSLCDENGNLLEQYTWDQVHLEAKYYPIWKQFIMEHGILSSDNQ